MDGFGLERERANSGDKAMPATVMTPMDEKNTVAASSALLDDPFGFGETDSSQQQQQQPQQRGDSPRGMDSNADALLQDPFGMMTSGGSAVAEEPSRATAESAPATQPGAEATVMAASRSEAAKLDALMGDLDWGM